MQEVLEMLDPQRIAKFLHVEVAFGLQKWRHQWYQMLGGKPSWILKKNSNMFKF